MCTLSFLLRSLFCLPKQVRQRRFDQERDNAVVLLQAAFEGHLVRKRLLGGDFPQSAEECNSGEMRATEGPQTAETEGEGEVTEGEGDEAIQIVQAAFKGHLVRKAFLNA